jgi:hypothetical protein
LGFSSTATVFLNNRPNKEPTMTLDEFNHLVNAEIQHEMQRAQRKAMLSALQSELDDAQRALDALVAAEIETDRRTNTDGYKSIDGQIAAFKAITAQANVLHLEKQIRGIKQ